MPAPPLTHHEILELVAPFSRRGRHVDLAASNRIERRLRFKPAGAPEALGPGGDRLAAASDTLELYSFGTGTCRLTRTLNCADGLRARVEAVGSRPEALLAQIETVAIERLLQASPCCRIARSFDLDTGSGAMVLTEAVVLIGVLRMTFTVSPVRGVAADITLVPAPGETLDLPEDLLAVLGWDWARLIRTKEGWRTKLRLRGDSARRTRRAELALERAALHLEQTLLQPPGAFHDRWRAARWGVVLRRAIPLLTFVALVGTVVGMPHIAAADGSELWMLLFQVPTALIALSFCLQELPQYEIPPLPRRSNASDWRRGSPSV